MTEVVAGSNPADPPKLQRSVNSGQWSGEISKLLSTDHRTPTAAFGAVAERRMHFPVEEDDDGSSPFGPAKS